MVQAAPLRTDSLPRSARAVIIGGGIAGASVAYHLTQHGWEDVVLVEQGPLWEAGGSTSHAPGLIFQLNPSRTMSTLAKWSVELFGGLELDGQPCFHGVGGIEVAATEERWEELDRRYGRALSYGLEPQLLDPGAVRERIPLIDAERILGGLLIPTDGIGKGVRAAEALGRQAANAGMRAFAGCRVTGLAVDGGRVREVETTLGTIRAEQVVVCAGFWGPRVAALAGVELALVPVVHQYAWTSPVAELAGEQREVVHPILRHQDRSMYFRQLHDAYGIGSYDHEPILVEPEDVADSGPGRHPSEQPFTPGEFTAAREEAGRLLPALREVELVGGVNGLMSFTPDGFPLLGETGGVRGLWLAEAIWVTHAGGAGRALAQLMTAGEIDLDMHECDPERFDGYGTSRPYARARGAQQYREVYDVIHPRQPPMPTRPLRTSPFYARELELGASLIESAGWERPQWYEANEELVGEQPGRSAWSAQFWSPVVTAEHLACRERVGVFDLTPFTKLRVSGPGALGYLQMLAANDVDRPPGSIVYTAMLSSRGGIMCDLTVTRLRDDAFLVVTGGAVGKHDLSWMRRHLPADGSVQLTDETSSFCCLGVWGPRARDLVASVSEDELDNEAFPYMTMREIHVGCVPVRALRISYVGELGWELYAPTEFGLVLWDTLWDAGSAFGAVACGGGAYDSLRLEKGYRLWGADIDEEHDPYEAGLGFAVKLGKGDFLGRGAVARAKDEGLRRKLCCLVIDDPQVVLVGKEPILDGERALGYVTSAGWGATVAESIAYGYLPIEHAEVGTQLSVHSEGRREPATVAEEPLFDPGMARLRDLEPAAVR